MKTLSIALFVLFIIGGSFSEAALRRQKRQQQPQGEIKRHTFNISNVEN